MAVVGKEPFGAPGWGFWASAHQAEASPGDVFLSAAVPINYWVPSSAVDGND
jgi:hypothetical protein